MVNLELASTSPRLLLASLFFESSSNRQVVSAAISTVTDSQGICLVLVQSQDKLPPCPCGHKDFHDHLQQLGRHNSYFEMIHCW